MPSEQYTQAHELFTKLYAAQLDDAFADPAMARVEELLRQVRDDSSDWRAAKELSRRIQEGRKAIADAEAARRIASAQASAPMPYQRMTPDAPKPSGAPAAPEKNAGANQPVPHMALSEFTSRFSGCFKAADKINVLGQGMFDSWELKDIANCRDRHPGFDQLLVLTDAKEIFTTVAKSLVEYRIGDAGSPTKGAQAASSSAR